MRGVGGGHEKGCSRQTFFTSVCFGPPVAALITLEWSSVRPSLSSAFTVLPRHISKGLYLRIFLHPSALTNHLVLSDLQKKSY